MKENSIYLLLGSNLGDSAKIIASAREWIAEKIGLIESMSLIYKTEPWGFVDQPFFLNQVISVKTNLTPAEVLAGCLGIEAELGRVREGRWGARAIDIDLLYFENLILDVPELKIPHPRLQERRFTLVPLAEIAPQFCHPILNTTSSELLERCSDDSKVEIYS